jgi:S1-C subfamily serine protease
MAPRSERQQPVRHGARNDGPQTATTVLLRGELFKAGEGNTSYKLRWFELSANGTLAWSEGEGTAVKGSADVQGAQIVLGRDERHGDEPRFNFGIVPASGAREYALQSSSAEERRAWVDAMEGVAHPDVARTSLMTTGRTVQIVKPTPPESIGIDLGSSPGLPCVTVMGIVSDKAHAAGLLTGDVVVQLNNTTLRNAAVARRTFAAANGTLVLKLLSWNRQIKLQKREGKAGLVCVSPGAGPGVLVSALLAGGSGEEAGLRIGDRLLAVNGVMLSSDHDRVSEMIRTAGQSVQLVVSGFSLSVNVRKDADGLLGLRFVDGPAPRGKQGAVVAEVRPRSTGREAGIRSGDLVVAVDGSLVADGNDATAKVAASARALNLTVWRAQPDAPQEPARTLGAAPVEAEADFEEDGAADWAYSNFNVMRGTPHEMRLYEDLTMPPTGGGAGPGGAQGRI